MEAQPPAGRGRKCCKSEEKFQRDPKLPEFLPEHSGDVGKDKIPGGVIGGSKAVPRSLSWGGEELGDLGFVLEKLGGFGNSGSNSQNR